MLVLVTGSTGLVGSALQEVTKDNNDPTITWFFASRKNADLTDLLETEMLFDRVQPTHVIHLAAKVGGLFANRKRNLQFYRINQLINTNVLETAYKSPSVIKCVSVMSTCIFPQDTKLPLSEKDLHNGLPHSSNIGYAMSKRNLDVLGKLLYSSNPKTLFTTVIPTNLYGPYDNFHLETCHVLPALIKKMYMAKLYKNEEVTLLGTGSARRQFMLAFDLALALKHIIVKYDSPEPIIVSPPKEITIKELTVLVAKKVGYKGKITFLGDPEDDGLLAKTVDTKKFTKLFPDFVFTPLVIGLAVTIQWFFKKEGKNLIS